MNLVYTIYLTIGFLKKNCDKKLTLAEWSILDPEPDMVLTSNNIVISIYFVTYILNCDYSYIYFITVLMSQNIIYIKILSNTQSQ